MELNQRYIEILDAIEAYDMKMNAEVIVRTDGQFIKFPNIEAVSAWLSTT